MKEPAWAVAAVMMTVLLAGAAGERDQDPERIRPRPPRDDLPKQHVTGKLPSIWTLAGNNQTEYEGGTDDTERFGGKSSGYIKSKGFNIAGYGVLATAVAAGPFCGRTVRLSAWVKTDDVQRWSGLWIGTETPAHRFTPTGTPDPWFNVDRSLRGCRDWKRYTLDLAVPADATRVLFGVAVAGRGTAYINEVRLDPVALPVVPVTPDLAFPGPGH